MDAEEALVPGGLLLRGAGEVAALPSFQQGLFHVQGLASQLAAAALDARPGQRVLDLCAAPGGKSATIAQAMQNTGELFCCDAAASRLPLIEKLLSRLGVTNARVLRNDAARPNPELTAMDRVLCDVPCSGLGVLAKKPDIRYKDLADLPRLIETQRAILACGRGRPAPRRQAGVFHLHRQSGRERSGGARLSCGQAGLPGCCPRLLHCPRARGRRRRCRRRRRMTE